MRKLTLMLPAVMLLTVFSLSADTVVTVTFTGAPYGNDSPYDLTVGTTAVLGTCISWNVSVDTNPSGWQANAEPITDFSASTTPTQVQVLEMEWLNLQFQYSPSSDWTGIQEAIWAINGDTSYQGANAPIDPFSSPSKTWQAVAAASYSLGEAVFEVLVPTTAGQSQTFLVNLTATPEPAALSLVGLALLGLGILRKRKAQRGA